MIFSNKNNCLIAALLASAVPAMAAVPINEDSELPCGGEVLVEAGDTLGGIAALCGVATADILAVNTQLESPDQLLTGQRLQIPSAVVVQIADTETLEALLAPFALYPDTLLAEILPASTYPLELVQAERWLSENPGREASDDQWAPSVNALTRYPEVITALSADLDATIQIGDAFLADPDAVFASIQSLRLKAQQAGNLEDNEYQKVVVEPVVVDADVEYVEPVIERRTVIRIVPSYVDRIYVPHYDPYWAYHHHANYHSIFHRPLWTFSIGYHHGYWNSHYLDWNHFDVRVFPRRYRSSHYRHYSGHYARNWGYWHHRPRHRLGYRYLAQPRARIQQGQRHLVNVRGNRQHRSSANYNRRDYRAGQRQRALNSSRGRNQSSLRQRVARDASGSIRRQSTRSAERRNNTVRRAQNRQTSSPGTRRGNRDSEQRAATNRRSTSANRSTTRASNNRRLSQADNTRRAAAPAVRNSDRTRNRSTRQSSRPRLTTGPNRSAERQRPQASQSNNRSRRAAAPGRSPAAGNRAQSNRSNNQRAASNRQSSAPQRKAPRAQQGNSNRKASAGHKSQSSRQQSRKARPQGTGASRSGRSSGRRTHHR